ncbi:MAG TPA: FG-GAP-like repeat-containing protein [Acetobacteraceae bacterium]|nr:FG-GAP-like repeat-containing protein [Acetobacteraceae bacterium]
MTTNLLAAAVAGSVIRISTSSSGQQANGGSYYPVFSGNGLRVAFESDATNLVAGDTNDTSDVFVKDLTTGVLTRISTAADGAQADGASRSVIFSANGRFAAFESAATNLVTGDTNGVEDLFVRNLETGAVSRVSTGASGNQADGDSYNALFSPDGTRLLFVSAASNLVAGDTNGAEDVFLKNLLTGAVTLISGGAVTGNGHSGLSHTGAFSPDGTRVVFHSDADDLVPGDTNGERDVFVKDLVTGTLTRVSTGPTGEQLSSFSTYAGFAGSAAKVAFVRHPVQPDGHLGQPDIYLKDLVAGGLSLVSATGGGQPSAGSDYPVISPDGTAIAFSSNAHSLLGPGETTTGAFLRDLAAGTLVRLDGTGTGAFPSGGSFPHAFSPDGRHVALHSFASNLMAGDTNGLADIFMRTLPQSLPALSVTGPGAPVFEGHPGARAVTFTVLRTGDTTGAASVAWAVTGSTPDPANEGDFAGAKLPAGTLAFAAGETAKSIQVPVAGDRVREGNEGFTLTLSNPTGATLGTPGATAIIRNDDMPARGDFDGGGVSDLLWRGAGGEVALWQMNGATVASHGWLQNPGSYWSIAGTGDFNGDDAADILWRGAGGEVAIWQMAGVVRTAAATLLNPGNYWTVAGTGDFNGDGTSDILWRGASGEVATWLVGGNTIAAAATLLNPGNYWRVAGTGDFDGDGTSDLLWRGAGGEVATWLMGAGRLVDSALLLNPGNHWTVAGTGDFNADGASDLLWRGAGGEVAIWLMGAGRLVDSALLLNPGNYWRVAGTGDFNGDHTSDILWRGGAGEVATWHMSGATVLAGNMLAIPGDYWQVAG